MPFKNGAKLVQQRTSPSLTTNLKNETKEMAIILANAQLSRQVIEGCEERVSRQFVCLIKRRQELLGSADDLVHNADV